MAASSTYKNPKSARMLTEENNFAGGMMYTDNTIDPTYLKTIINFDYDNMRGSLVSRKGLEPIQTYELPEELTLFTIDFAYLAAAPEDLYVHQFLKPTMVLGTYTTRVEVGVADAHQPLRHTVHYGEEVDFYEKTCTINSEYVTDCILLAQPNDFGNYCAYTLSVLVRDPDTGDFVRAEFGAIYDVDGRVRVEHYTDDTWGRVRNKHGRNREICCTASGAQFYLQHLENYATAFTPVATVLQNTVYFMSKSYFGYQDPVLGAQLQVDSEFSKLRLCKIDNTLYACVVPVAATAITAREAINSGYNSYRGSRAYTFQPSEGINGIDGILPKHPTTKETLLTARLGQEILFDLIYTYDASGGDIVVKWEWAQLNNTQDPNEWYSIGTTTTTTLGSPIQVSFKPPVDKFIVRASMYRGTDTDPVAVAMLPINNLVNARHKATLKTYDLATAKGLLTWQSRVVLYGVSGADNMVFISDINDPGYFPYPNNVHILDDAVLKVVPYLDGMLVFTRAHIYLIEQGPDGITFTSKVVQNRLNLTEGDVPFVQVVKNMVFFKSGDSFYMVVPKATSLTGELTIAPISKLIQSLLSNADTAVPQLVRAVYEPWFIETEDPRAPEPYKVLPLPIGFEFNYVDGNIIRNAYVVSLYAYPARYGEPPTPARSGPELLVFFNYDTVTRAWSLHIVQGNGRRYVPYQQLSTRNSQLLNTYGGVPALRDPAYLQILSFTNPTGQDSQKLNTFKTIKNVPTAFNNISFIDTGYRKHAEAIKKRYRELQFTVYSMEEQALSFGTAFLIDGTVRHSYSQYESVFENGEFIIQQSIMADIATPTSNGYVLNHRDSANPYTVDTFGTTTLDDTAGEMLNAFTLDTSALPSRSAIKVRIPVTGKGYAPRLQLRSFVASVYELTNINWVYRLMSGR